MNSQVKMPEKVWSNIFIEEKTTKKVLVMFLDVEIITER